MKPNELFDHIWDVDYNKSGFDLDWLVEVDNDEKKVRLLFCPSNSAKDWIVNIGGFLPYISFPFVMCFGWKHVFDECKKQIMEEFIRKINDNKCYEIEICGHSYGGAESIIAAIELYKQTKIKANVITFGAPRPMIGFLSALMVRFCVKSIIQYAHWSDCVTYCPPLIGYHNVKTKRLGKFNFINLFKPNIYHMIYDDETLY